MTQSHPDPDLELLRRRLRAGDRSRTWGPAERLAHALTGEPASELSCAEVQAQLPACADAELRGVAIARRYPEVARHLLSCEECSALYALMLERELAPALEPLPAPVGLDALRQEQRFAEVRGFVLGVANAILEAVQPAALPGLADAVQAFFDQLRALGGTFRLEPAAAHALGQGGDLSPAVRFLMASFLATQELAQTLSVEQRKGLAASEELRATLLRAAQRAAADSGLKGTEARRFAEAYVNLVTTSETTLPEWPANE